MVLASSPQLKTMPGSQREKSTLNQGTRSLHSPLTEARLGMRIASTMRPGPILTPVISDRKSHSAILRSRGLRRAKFSCAPGRAGKRGRATCQKVPIMK
jgi:hypothetical protein